MFKLTFKITFTFTSAFFLVVITWVVIPRKLKFGMLQGYRYHKLRLFSSKFYRRHYECDTGVKHLPELEFYGDFV